MTSDITKTLNISQLQMDLMEAIDEIGGVECSQVPDLFFPEEWGRKDPRMARLAEKTAREICLRCPVMAKCLKVGQHEEFGIWGGTTPAQRKQIKRSYDI